MRDIAAIVVDPRSSITEAVRIIDEGTLGIALVMEGGGRLMGVVTDVDLRKAILAGVPLDAPVTQIMNERPVIAHCNESRASMLGRLNEKTVRQLPILDENGRVVGIELLGELLKPKSRPNKVVVMAGGLGERLRPLTCDTPKPLLKVGDTPLLRTIVEALVDAGFRTIYVMVRYLADKIRDYLAQLDLGAKFVCVDEPEPLGTCGSLRLLPRGGLRDPLLVMNGDILTKINFGHLLDYHISQGATATIATVHQSLRLPYGVVDLDGQWVRSLQEKPEITHHINAGIYVLDPALLDLIPQGCFDMPQLLSEALGRNMPVGCFPLREFWMDIGQIHDFNRAQDVYRDIF